MARPTAFTRQTSFTQFSSQFPSKPQNGASLDAEFNAVKVALDETQTNLAKIQDDDGALARGSVGRAQLDASIELGFGAPSTWKANTVYDANASTVFYQAKFYIATTTHVSGDSFDATKWEEIADLSASNAIDDGSITDAKLASNAVTAEKIGPLAVTEPKIASGAVSTAKIADAAVTFAKLANDVGPALASLVIPAGLGPLPWSGRTAPAGWVLMGATYNRAEYPALWAFASAEIASGNNSIYGAGDGSTTFTIIDPKGCAIVAIDPSTSVVGGLTKVGATTGSKSQSIAKANLPSTTFPVTIPSGQGSHGHGASTDGAKIIGNGQSGGESGRLAGSGASITINNATLPAMSGTAASGGSGTPLDIVQPSLGANFIIKAH